MSARQPRLMTLLLALASEPLNANQIAQRCQWESSLAHKSLSNARRMDYIEATGHQHAKQMTWQLTPKGRAAVARERTAKGHGVDGQSGSLIDEALAMIRAAGRPVDSGQIADRLGVAQWLVVRALAPALEDHRLVGCKLMRDGQDLVQYRPSIGRPNTTWWEKTGEPETPPPRRSDGVDIDSAHRPPNDRSAAAEPALENVTDSSGDATIVEPAREGEFWIALFSTGELNVQRRDGSQVSFDADETRELFRWLDRLGGTQLERLAAVQEPSA